MANIIKAVVGLIVVYILWKVISKVFIMTLYVKLSVLVVILIGLCFVYFKWIRPMIGGGGGQDAE